MPCIHPSEDPPLGWLVPCLAVADLGRALAFYAVLGLEPIGGDQDKGWAILRSRATELHLFEGHIERDLLNFRGGALGDIASALKARGLSPTGGSGFEGRTYLDPDGRPVFFDTAPDEATAYAAGQPLTVPISGDLHAGSGIDLGNLTCCMNCADLATSVAFYERIGFETSGGDTAQGWAILARRDDRPGPGRRTNGVYLSLFQDMLPEDMLNFRGGNVSAIADHVAAAGIDLGAGVTPGEDGGESLLVRDPDGRAVFFDTTPVERLYREPST